MIRIITSRRLAEMESERNRLRQQASTAEDQAQQALDREIATQLRLAGERAQLEKQCSGADFARELAETANTKLRAEVEELVEEVRQGEAGPRCVYVLTRFGEPRSGHTSQEAAKAEAVRLGAPAGAWGAVSPEKPLADAAWAISHVCIRTQKPGGAP
ncbi:hypothetical protein [Streptomyces albidus (ex Kaewkla and Franco 2022)]|uniref:hypothetical protein n=1 Tax=Streptomyces albidus (ex Kaewkla and Franco 2022) TaxID=722709 RepID=UPI0015EEF42E|nr:hypothetical protein [Streptomyces albidus (ex Kaewkla and Franco 2022)]